MPEVDIKAPASGITPISVTPEEDFISRAINYKPAEKTIEKSPTSDNQEFFDYKEIESITDPRAKDIAIKAYKSMQAGFTKKTQELSEKSKTFEQKMNEMKNWSPERIQNELLNNPQFLSAAQQFVPNNHQTPNEDGITEEEFSVLSDKEKAELLSVKNKLQTLEEKDKKNELRNYQMMIENHDLQLKAKYKDYDSNLVDQGIADLAKMEPKDIRVYVYKAMKYDDHIQAMARYRMDENNKLNQEKSSAFSQYGNNAITSGDLPVKSKEESGENYFVRLARNRLSQMQNGNK